MVTCNCYPNHEVCKNRSTCELWIDLTPELRQVNNEIEYELSKLRSLKLKKQQYNEILYEIQQGIYNETIHIYGKFYKAPKMNVLGEYIIKSHHVQVGLNYNDIVLEIKDQESIIRALRFKENRILNSLKKKVS